MVDNQNKMEEACRVALSSVPEVIDRDLLLGEKFLQLFNKNLHQFFVKD